MSQFHDNHGQIVRIGLRNASAPTVFCGYFRIQIWPQRLLAVRRSQRMLRGKRFCSDEDIIAETDAHFEGKEKSFYKAGIEKLEKR